MGKALELNRLGSVSSGGSVAECKVVSWELGCGSGKSNPKWVGGRLSVLRSRESVEREVED